MRSLLTITAIISLFGSVSCGPKAFVKGQYDDVERENLMNDQFSETDMQKIVADMVKSMTQHPTIQNAKNPPIVMVTGMQNKTSEHIDTQSIMDMVRVELMKTGKVGFIDKEAREDIKAEYDYQGSGIVDESTKKGPGGQVGADLIINGRIDSIVQEVGKDKTVYYKVTLNLTNLKTSVIMWSDHKQIRKAFKKKAVGL
ncbi:MAG: penicillin-binding protein activator LpoB [Bdellovibrionia bacterium]